MKPKNTSLLALLLAIGALPAFSNSPPATTLPTYKRPVLLSGEVVAKNSQSIFVPPSNSSPVVLRNFIPEGSSAKTGDLLLRIETPSSSNIDQLQTAIQQTQAKTALEVAKLEVAALEAEKILMTAQADLAKAMVDAVLPKAQISALDYDRHQAERERAGRDLEVKQQSFANAKAAVTRRRADGELEFKKQQINLAYSKARLALSEVRARQDGIVVHGYSAWRGERYEEGSSAYPGNLAGQVMGSGQMEVQAWALEADRPFLHPEQAVVLNFDALPGFSINARINTIAGTPEERPNWGNGRYFRLEIKLSAQYGNVLVPGMSVSVEPQGNARPTRPALPAKPAELTIEGEIQSRASIPVSPPSIPYVWQYTLAQLVPEGTLVRAGQMIATFQTSEVNTQLDNQRSTLKEKQRALEKFMLDQAEAEKSGNLDVDEAQSNAEKAARKASMPKELIRRVDYDKLVIERRLHAELARLALQRRTAQGRARKAERSGLESEITQLQKSIDVLTKGQKALTVLAPRTGMVMYRTNFNGDKFTTGSQVWMGLSVATLADPDKLFVNAKVPEAQAASVHVGQRARISVPGANLVLPARVSALGSVYHGKSTTQAIVVRDVELEFENPSKGLKPGSAVQATLLSEPAKPSLGTNGKGKT